MSIQDYEHPALTADVILFAIGDDALSVLLIQRGRPPFQNAWAFPGGFVEVGESPWDAACRELKEETGVQDIQLDQLRTFGAPGRDPRGHVVSVVYLAVLAARAAPQPMAGSDAAAARWWSIGDLPPMAFDHAEILNFGLQRLQAVIGCPSVVRDGRRLRPEQLTAAGLRRACQAIAAKLEPVTSETEAIP